MGHRSSKNLTLDNEPLSRETIDELCHDTGFTEDELLNWHMYALEYFYIKKTNYSKFDLLIFVYRLEISTKTAQMVN